MYRFLLIALVLNVFSTNTFAQSYNDFERYLIVSGDVFTAPAHFDKKDIITLTASMGAVVGAYFLDEPIRKLVGGNKNTYSDFLFSIDKYAIEAATVAVTGVYLYGLAAKDNKTRDLGLRLIEAYTMSELVNYTIKILTGRARPLNNLGNDHFDPIRFDFLNTSFPSGHTAMGFSLGKVMEEHLNTSAWSIFWYTFGSIMGAARIYNDFHWFSDVVAGGLLSYFISDFIVNHYTNKPGNNGTRGVSFSLKIIL